MGRFQHDIEAINQLVDDLESDLDRTTQRIEQCLERLDELAGKLAHASKVLREEAAIHRVNIVPGTLQGLR